MGEDPRAIREEIEDTRGRMGDTVDALAYKADVKTRAKESVSDKVTSVKEKVVGAKDSVTESVGGAKESVTGTVSDRTPDSEQVKHQAKRAVGVAQENPLGLALGSVAVGFVAGMLIPSTRVENEKLGPMADQVKEKAQETGQAALEHGKQVAQDVAETAKDAGQQAVQQTKEAAQSSGQEHAQQVKDEAKGKAGETHESEGSSSPGGSF
jgi:gas vesicle protein